MPVPREESDLTEIGKREVREDLYLNFIRHQLHTAHSEVEGAVRTGVILERREARLNQQEGE